ncbi:MAG: hypothetical protein ACM37W_08325 [Actinomycetota bacterium]
MLTSFDYLRHEMQLELDYFESQIKEYELDRESFSEWLIHETRGKVLILRKMLNRAEAIAAQERITALVDEVLSNPPLTTKGEVEAVAADEPEFAQYSEDYAPQKLVIDAGSMGLVCKVERFERYPAGWVAWLSVRVPGRATCDKGDRFWVSMPQLFRNFRPLSARPAIEIERSPSSLYSLGSVKTRAELKQVFGISPPISPSLYHTIIEMLDGSKWQAIASPRGGGHRWQCVWCNGDGYSDLFPGAA